MTDNAGVSRPPDASVKPIAAGEPGATNALDDDFRVLALDLAEPIEDTLEGDHGDLPEFSVFIRRAALINITRHCERGLQTDREVAGGLVGHPLRDSRSGRVYTRINSAPALKGHSSKYEVVILPEEWTALSTRIQEQEGGEQDFLIGWYHSHPTFEAYLSDTDQLTQSQFFGEPWNIAIVVGPLLRQIKSYHGKYSQECHLFLDPEETGGALVPVTYEVSAGPVSTDEGIEQVELWQPMAEEAPDPWAQPASSMAVAERPDGTGFTPLVSAEMITMSEAAPAPPPVPFILSGTGLALLALTIMVAALVIGTIFIMFSS